MERKRCEFFLVRYVPDLVKGEFVNIGVLLREEAEAGAMALRFTRDWRRLRCSDAEVDPESLEALESELRQRMATPEAGLRPLLEVMRDSWSLNLQLSPSKGYLAENLAAGMDQLMDLYVASRKRETVARKSGRQAIYGAMRREFERAGAWELMRKRIAAAAYTRPGDPLRIDCGYRPNGVIRMFHAVSLEGDLESAKVLAFSVAGLRDGIRRKEQAELELTAIVEPLGAWDDPPMGKSERRSSRSARAGSDEDAGSEEAKDERGRLEQYRFAVETMEQETIRVLTTADLPERRRLRGGSYGCERESGIEQHQIENRRHGPSAMPFLLAAGKSGSRKDPVTLTESVQSLWKRWTGSVAAAEHGPGPRKTLALPSILGPYQSPASLLPKPTPLNLRRFAETPLARRAINVIKDRIAGLDWQIKLKRGYPAGSVSESEARCAILRQTLEEPNYGDSFRTLLEQVLEDALVGGYGTIEMELTGNRARPFELWPVDGATIKINAKWDGTAETPRYAQATGMAIAQTTPLGGDLLNGNIPGLIPLRDDQLIYIRLNPRTYTPFGLGPLEVAFET